MAHETSKMIKHWKEHRFENDVLFGEGKRILDIGPEDDCLPGAEPFDLEQGDANHILDYLEAGSFDVVFSSHCLEHMKNIQQCVIDWWALVKPGGYLFIIVPDEDLYEQGHWPSIYNPDHKATFTISKRRSWSPVSINALALATFLPNSQLISIQLQDNGYDRTQRNKDQTLNGAQAQIQFVIHKKV